MTAFEAKLGPKIGCCGFPVRRERYFEHFGVVEIQKTFYQPPSLHTMEKLRAEAPPGFEFTLKAWQLITHEPTSPTYRRLAAPVPDNKRRNYGFFKPTSEVFGAWQTTRSVAEALKAKVIVFQCPASFQPTPENKANMRQFFRAIERCDFQLVWEPRGNWAADEIRELCEELNLVHCVDPFKASPTSGAFRYFRLHGKTGYRYKYSDDDLQELKSRIEGDSLCYVMFNNVPMFDDALRFMKILGK